MQTEEIQLTANRLDSSGCSKHRGGLIRSALYDVVHNTPYTNTKAHPGIRLHLIGQDDRDVELLGKLLESRKELIEFLG